MHHGNENGGCGHSHSHGHDHCCSHCHGNGQQATPEQELAAVLTYMLDHNRHHADELAEMVIKADDLGYENASKEIEAAIAEYKKGNDRLATALLTMKKES